MAKSDDDKRRRSDVVHVLTALWKNHDAADVEAALKRDFTLNTGKKKRDLVRLFGHDLRFVQGAKILVGGGGVVVPCEEAGSPGVKYALKVPRPSLFPPDAVERAKEEIRKAKLEQRTHLPLSHANIAKLYGTDTIEVTPRDPFKLELPCTLIEWVEGARPLGDYLCTLRGAPHVVADVLEQACSALAHLHDAGKIHWDIKGDNVLISDDGTVKLMDLGNARDVRADGAKYSSDDAAETSPQNVPPELAARLKKAMEEAKASEVSRRISLNRVPCRLHEGEKVWDRPWLDLYMLAREVNRLFGFDEDALELDARGDRQEPRDLRDRREAIFAEEEGGFVYRYLCTVVSRLLQGSSPDREPFYLAAAEVARTLKRLTPEYGEATTVQELQAVPQHVLRIPPLSNVPWTPRIEAVMNSAPLLRSKGHRQLATVRHVFPGAEHTRWEHIVGTLEELLQRVRALFADRAAVRFRLDTSKLDVMALMLGALVHDLGHPAYGHQLEESPLVPPALRHERYARDVLYAITAADAAGAGAAASDAAVLRDVLERHWVTPDVSLSDLVQRTIEIFEAGDRPVPVDEPPSVEARRLHTELLHSLLDGQLDADKADYLVRDAHHCGVEYPNGIDRRRLDQALTALVVRVDGRTTGTIGVTQKGLLPLESMLIARYQMFRAVYWQHTVRAMTVMLQEVVEQYVVKSVARPGNTAQRLEEVLRCFREDDDEDALRWLQEQLGAQRLKHMCDGILGDRTQVFWRVTDFLPGPPRKTPSDDEKVYNGVLQLWAAHTDVEDGVRLVGERRALREQVAQAISEGIASGEQVTAVKGVDASDLLLDIPLLGRDEVRDLFVLDVHAADPEPRPIEQLTPLAQSVAEAFRSSVRPLRIYVAPTVGHRIAEAGEWQAFTGLVRAQVTREFDRQLRLDERR